MQVEKRAIGNVDQRRGLVELELAHVAEAQLERQAGRSLPPDLEHRRRRVDAEHGLARRAHDLDRDPPAPHHQLDDRPVRLAGERDVVGHVLGHVGCPRVVDGSPGVVFAHPRVVSEQMSASRVFAFTQPRLAAGAAQR